MLDFRLVVDSRSEGILQYKISFDTIVCGWGLDEFLDRNGNFIDRVAFDFMIGFRGEEV